MIALLKRAMARLQPMRCPAAYEGRIFTRRCQKARGHTGMHYARIAVDEHGEELGFWWADDNDHWIVASD